MLTALVKSRFEAGLDRLGNANPQLLREWRGAVGWRSAGLTLLGSLLAQGIFALFWWERWATLSFSSALDRCDGPHYLYRYTFGKSFPDRAPDLDGSVACADRPLDLVEQFYAVHWPSFWFDILSVLSIGGAIALGVATAFLLNENFSREARRGTLDFLRASPRSSQGILAGKVAGAPALAYLGALSLLPLQLGLAAAAQVSPIAMLAWDGLVLAALAALCALVLVYVTLGGRNGLLAIALSLAALLPPGLLGFAYLQGLHPAPERAEDYILHQLYWWTLSLEEPGWAGYGFLLVSLLGIAFGLWRVANRRFRRPRATFASKGQSYWGAAAIHLWLLGFAVRGAATSSDGGFDSGASWVMFLILVPWVTFVAMALTLPNRQALSDWARYRHLQRSAAIAEAGHEVTFDGAVPAGSPLGNRAAALPGSVRRQSPWEDWLRGENSPVLLSAIAQVLLAIALWSPGLLQADGLPGVALTPQRAVAAAGLVFGWMLVSIALVQWLTSLRSRYPAVLAAGGLFGFWTLSVTLAVLLAGQALALPVQGAVLAMLPWFVLGMPSVTVTPAAIALAALFQGLAFAGFAALLHRQLDALGRSELRELLAAGERSRRRFADRSLPSGDGPRVP